MKDDDCHDSPDTPDRVRKSTVSKPYEILQPAHREEEAPTKFEPVPSGIEPDPISINFVIPHHNAVGLFQNIEACLPNHKKRIVQFIGSRRREGVSTIVFELAKVTAERLGKSVLLLYDGRFQPALSSLPSHQSKPVLDEFLRGECTLEEVVCRVGTAPLFVVDYSTKPSVPISQIFTSSAMTSILEKLGRQFDLVLIDSPSLDACADGLAIAPRVDGVVLVVEAGRTPAPVARKAKESIIQCGGSLLGIVFNRKRNYIPDWLYCRL